MKSWNDGGKEDCFDRLEISVTHDELVASIGAVYHEITNAGFVLVPKRWRDDALKALSAVKTPA